MGILIIPLNIVSFLKALVGIKSKVIFNYINHFEKATSDKLIINRLI
jgi:hypothetical protein